MDPNGKGGMTPEARVRVTGVRAATEDKVVDGKKSSAHFLVLDTTAGSLSGLKLTAWEMLALILNDCATNPEPGKRAAAIRDALKSGIKDVQTAKGAATERTTKVMSVSTL